MTPAEFTTALRTLGWTHAELARRLACDTNLPSRWASGRAPVPERLGEWLAERAQRLKESPPPPWREWRRATFSTPDASQGDNP